MATIIGTPGNDTLVGTRFADTIFGLAGNDLLLGLGGNDTLYGGRGNDTLNGGAGIDSLVGGPGNDVYIINNPGDIVVEAENAGIDLVRSSVSYTLGNNVENLTLTGTRAINGIGNDLNNVIRGNAANNQLVGDAADDTLYGGDGNDILYGDFTFSEVYYTYSGNDILYGGDGDDTLNGGFPVNYFGLLTGGGSDTLYGGNGNDLLFAFSGSFRDEQDVLYGGNGNDTLDASGGGHRLYGGQGDDTYIINDSSVEIIEAANAGIDTVRSSVSVTLSDNVENLILVEEFFVINGTGNNQNNTIIGNSQNNILRGLAGNDTLIGGAGNDTLAGSSGGVSQRDVLTGGTGADTFFIGANGREFYDDGNELTPGYSSYALITDFNPAEDIIKLNSNKNNYLLASTSGNLPSGIGVFLRKTGEPNELIAIIQGSSDLSLDGNYFQSTIGEIQLLLLDGTDGSTLNSIDTGTSSNTGISVSSAGDINGDGFDDVIIGESKYARIVPTSERGYVVFGSASGFGANLDLANLDGANGFRIDGVRAQRTSVSVSSAGDINGDGFDDIILGVFEGDNYGFEGASRSYVVFGKASGFEPSLNLANLDGTNGFAINSTNPSDRSGFSVSNAGDVNGDGLADLIVGSPGTNSSYVVFGNASGFEANFDLATLDGTNGFRINGAGFAVSNAGDVNGDGFDDLIVGNPNGQSYVVFGRASGFEANFDLGTIDGTNGFQINGINAGDRSGFSVSSAGDVNGDGFADLIVGSAGTNSSYVVFGNASGFEPSLNLANLDGTNGFRINDAGFGVSSAGDVNGDGFDDLIVSNPNADPSGQSYAGESYVVFGKASGFEANFDLATLDGTNGFQINGISAGDLSGYSVSSAGDVNGDGFADLILGSPFNLNNRETGQSYVIYGRDFSNKVNRLGTPGDDLLIGTNSDDILIGGLGNDTLRGGRGSDVLYGGAGDDVLIFGPRNRRMDGGSGTDTLAIEISNLTMDLTTLPSNRISGIEIIDLTGTGNNSLKLTRLNLLNLSDTTNQLIVKGNAGDRITSTQQGWLLNGTTMLEGQVYDRYTSGTTTLLVDTEITRILS
ncbi:FG-GAP repeat protein [Gloeocapsopsis crepidinum LEGE 06123]|uniref:FG-GAP repeat protein n=1 Tax=Gloeocapsopsis crepidinum LEGE 06123 TaxID=588587 RepID=A0ABR9UX52_9CHRO|nr:FG-GAP-like repeat-containing protein [Gloeocapsopsis crepidinum]MBE9192560.1 FG-GAP repeat protein [Gloeocapsopsis crepidinum LEGE 06123]